MTKAKLREADELQRFECINLGQENVERSSKGILGLCVWRENIDRNISLNVH
jgi:hypothetical protein